MLANTDRPRAHITVLSIRTGELHQGAGDDYLLLVQAARRWAEAIPVHEKVVWVVVDRNDHDPLSDAPVKLIERLAGEEPDVREAWSLVADPDRPDQWSELLDSVLAAME